MKKQKTQKKQKQQLFARLERAKELTDELARLLTRPGPSRLASTARSPRRTKRLKSASPR